MSIFFNLLVAFSLVLLCCSLVFQCLR